VRAIIVECSPLQTIRRFWASGGKSYLIAIGQSCPYGSGCDVCAFAALGVARSSQAANMPASSLIRGLLSNRAGEIFSLTGGARVFLPGHTLRGLR
jgi:hypothetical protein